MNPKGWKFYVVAIAFVLLLEVLRPRLMNMPPVSAPSIEWKRSYGGSGNDGAHSIQQTTDGVTS